MAITVIENEAKRPFIEAILPNREEAEAYLQEHPQKEACKLKEMEFGEFPFYFVETDGKFFYFSTKDELIDYIKNADIRNITKYYSIITGMCSHIFFSTKEKLSIHIANKRDGKIHEEIEVEEELSFTIYKIYEPFKKNEDCMGGMDHSHLTEVELNEIKNGNMRSLEYFSRGEKCK